ncbi:MAG: GGDEF domain-containing protein [Oscillospiraceae bacterium]
MNSYDALNANSYRIGRVTIDLSMHTQSADEAFFHYFGNDVLYSIKRIIHEEDYDSFKDALKSAEKSGNIKTVVRMKGYHDDYRYILASMSRNIMLSKDDSIFIDILLHDVLSLERLMYAAEYKVNEHRFLLSMCKDLSFEYNFETKRLKIYYFDSYRDIIITDEEIDVWKKSVIENKFIESCYYSVIDSICSDIKNGVYRFEYEFESSIFSFGRKNEFSRIKGVTKYDDLEHKKVVGIISMVNPRTNSKNTNFSIELNMDSLTEVMNRSAIINYAKDKIANQPEYSVNIVILNLDGFKAINNTYGHTFGDEVLYQTGKILKTEIGSRGISGRIAGDEFMIVIEGTIDEIDLRGILRAIRTGIEFSFADRNIKITCSMGIASYPKDSSSYDEIFSQANLALRIAKNKGGNRYVIYDVEKHGRPDDYSEKSGTVKSKVGFVSSICEEIFTAQDNIINDVLRRIAEMFETDAINIYFGREVKCIYSTAERLNDNAEYFINGEYSANFNSDGVFAVDNTNMLEGRSQEAFLYFSENNVMSVLQCLIYDNGQIKGIISYELIGHSKKWSDTDINYLTIVSRAISNNILKNNSF